MSTDLEALGERIATHAAHIDAATHSLLTDLREFDSAGGWYAQGARSCVEWLSWRVGWSLGTAREHLRVARKLAELPQIDDALRRGALSYCKVRAITRVATRANEATLLEDAQHATGAQLERICRKYGAVLRAARDPEQAYDRERRYVRRLDLEDGMVKIEAVLHPEEAATLWAALDAVARATSRSTPHTAAGSAETEVDATMVPTAGGAILAGTCEATTGTRYVALDGVDEPTTAGNATIALASEPTIALAYEPTINEPTINEPTINEPTINEPTINELTIADDATTAAIADDATTATTATTADGATTILTCKPTTANLCKATLDATIKPTTAIARPHGEGVADPMNLTVDDGREGGADPSRTADDGREDVADPMNLTLDDGREGGVDPMSLTVEDPTSLTVEEVVVPRAGADAGARASGDADTRPTHRDWSIAPFDRADALVSIARDILRGERVHAVPTELVVTVAAETLAHPHTAPDPFAVAADGTCVSAETARRLACDCGLVAMVEDASGTTLSVGRKTRSIPTSMKRALLRRDTTCRFPGCCNRVFVEGHHIEHWANGGETNLDNLVGLCGYHHRFVHEYGYRVELDDQQRPSFFDPNGRRVSDAPPRPALPQAGMPTLVDAHHELDISAETNQPRWDGDPLRYDWIIDDLVRADRLV